jgi:hypothetical protein
VLGLQMNDPKFTIESMIFTLSGIVILTLVGGWFGSRLFPPLIPGKRRRGFD